MHSRRALTLVELVVVIAIIGTLLVLLIPAAQVAREAARRVQYQNNVKEISLAVPPHMLVCRITEKSNFARCQSKRKPQTRLPHED